jgi:hypothetical protein
MQRTSNRTWFSDRPRRSFGSDETDGHGLTGTVARDAWMHKEGRRCTTEASHL